MADKAKTTTKDKNLVVISDTDKDEAKSLKDIAKTIENNVKTIDMRKHIIVSDFETLNSLLPAGVSIISK